MSRRIPQVQANPNSMEYWKEKVLTRSVSLDLAIREFFEALNSYMRMVEVELTELKSENTRLKNKLKEKEKSEKSK